MTEYKIDRYQKVFLKILNFVSYKPRTEKEISSRLNVYVGKERISDLEKEELKERVLSQLKLDGYIDDKKTGKLYLDSYLHSQKSKSTGRFKQDLRKKGFKQSDIDNLTSDIPVEQEKEGALKEGQKRLNRFKKEPIFVKKAKLSNFLYSKGYSTTTIKAVVDTLLPLQ